MKFKGIVKEDLSQQQIDYFKNSKVRDKDGNLIVCYHGTTNPGFKEFNPKANKSQFGKYKFGNYNVNYFTKDKDSASGYTQFKYDDGTIYACYLNIVNPYIVNNKTEAEIKTSFNIKDDRLREKQIKLFDSIFNKWKGKIMDYSDPRFQELNNDLHKLNLELRPNDSYYDSDTDAEDIDYFNLYTLGNNSFFGAEHTILYAYSTDEIFDDEMYDELKDTIIGEPDDYFFSTDDIVRYVISLNEEDGEDYDGIIIPDIYDSTKMFSPTTTDYITLKSANQIKLIDNINPTSSNRIDESSEEEKVEKIIKSRNYEQISDIEMISYIYNGELRNGVHYDNYKHNKGDKVLVYDAWVNAKDKYSALNKLRRKLGFGTLSKDELDSDIEDGYCIVEESGYYDEEHDVTYQWYVSYEDVELYWLKKESLNEDMKNKSFSGIVYRGEKPGGNNGIALYGYGKYFTDNKDTARLHGNTNSYKINIENPLIFNAENYSTLDSYVINNFEHMVRKYDPGYFTEYRVLEELKDGVSTKIVKELGYDGVIVNFPRYNETYYILFNNNYELVETILRNSKGIESLNERTSNYNMLSKVNKNQPYERYWFAKTFKNEKSKEPEIHKIALQLQTDDINIVDEILKEIIPFDYDRIRIFGSTNNLNNLKDNGYELLSLTEGLGESSLDESKSWDVIWTNDCESFKNKLQAIKRAKEIYEKDLDKEVFIIHADDEDSDGYYANGEIIYVKDLYESLNEGFKIISNEDNKFDNKVKKENVIVDIYYDRRERMYAVCLKDKSNGNILSDYDYTFTRKEAEIIKQDMLDNPQSFMYDVYELNESLNEVYPNKGENKKDFTKRFMKVTKDEYPDIKQRYAVCMSYWNRRNKKRKNESLDEDLKQDIDSKCGYVKEDGSLIVLNEYHGEEGSQQYYGLPEFSNTHPEEDTCIRIFDEPNNSQYNTLEKIIDYYLDREEYCKLEIAKIVNGRNKYLYYKIYSLYEGACDDSGDEKVGNWTGYDLIKVIKNYFKYKDSLNEKLLRGAGVDVFYTDSPYQARDYILNHNEPQRIYINEEQNVYLISNGYNCIHRHLINLAKAEGYLDNNISTNDFIENGISCLYNPNHSSIKKPVFFFSNEEDFNKFKNCELYKLLNKDNDIQLQLSNY